MYRLPHYLHRFQAFVVSRAKMTESRFDKDRASDSESEARYRSNNAHDAWTVHFQLECIARNRQGYTDGLRAIANDPCYS